MVRITGGFVSGLGHVAVIGLAIVGPPFLWAPRDRPVPAVAVALLSPAELAALMRPPTPPPPVAAAPQDAAPAQPLPMPPPLVPPPAAEAPAPPMTTLAPAFDAAEPLGVGEAPLGEASGQAAQGGAARPAPAVAGESGPAAEAAEPEVDPEELRVAYAAQVQRAVTRARVYPRVARDRGLEGRVLFQLVLSRDGRLLSSQLLRSSGAMTLDRAALETIRKAAYPPAPPMLEGERLPFAVEVVFTGSDR